MARVHLSLEDQAEIVDGHPIGVRTVYADADGHVLGCRVLELDGEMLRLGVLGGHGGGVPAREECDSCHVHIIIGLPRGNGISLQSVDASWQILDGLRHVTVR